MSSQSHQDQGTTVQHVLSQNYQKHLWAIILAGGNGSRISDLIRQWKGRPVPKQYCAFVGKKSMLEHTILRADRLIHPEHQRILIARDHYRDAQPQLEGRSPGSVIMQPSNCDTLPGLFLPLTHVYARDSNATVIIYPSDHFIHPQEGFLSMMKTAVQAVEDLPDRLLLIGVPADSPELDYGWIYPAENIRKASEHPVFKVEKFLEKPSRKCAAIAMACGAMWNTMIMVVKARTLWQLGCIYAPEILRHFERLYEAIGTSSEKRVLESIYAVMPSRNFSTDLLTPATGHIGLLPMRDVLWSDWGQERRIVETLHQIGKQPNFPMIPAPGNERPQKHAGNLSIAS